jgi:hypothetical protein
MCFIVADACVNDVERPHKNPFMAAMHVASALPIKTLSDDSMKNSVLKIFSRIERKLCIKPL